MVSTLDSPQQIDKVHASLIRSFMKNVLPHYMKNYVLQNERIVNGKIKNEILVCPLIVGGVNIQRCASLSPAASKLVKQMRVNDIDIKFLMGRNCTKYKSIDEVDTMRREFISEIFSKNPHLNMAIEKARLPPSIKVSFKTSYRFADPLPPDESVKQKHEKIRLHRLAYVDAVYFDSKSKKELGSARFMDTTLFGYEINADAYLKHVKAMKKEANYSIVDKQVDLIKIPGIPIYIHRGIYYGSCMWNYLDTVRMLDIYAEIVSDPSLNTNVKDQLYNLEHFVKYLAKFIVMYIHINNTQSDERLIHLRKVFYKSHSLHKYLISEKFEEAVLMHKNVDPKYLKLAFFYKHVLDKNTNLQDLRKLIAD